jgi:hypothetical protein
MKLIFYLFILIPSFSLCHSLFPGDTRTVREKRFAVKVANVVRKIDEDQRSVYNDKGKFKYY